MTSEIPVPREAAPGAVEGGTRQVCGIGQGCGWWVLRNYTHSCTGTFTLEGAKLRNTLPFPLIIHTNTQVLVREQLALTLCCILYPIRISIFLEFLSQRYISIRFPYYKFSVPAGLRNIYFHNA